MGFITYSEILLQKMRLYTWLDYDVIIAIQINS